MKQFILLSFVTASISFTVTESFLFFKLREYLKTKSYYLGKLFSCGYCFSHWISLLLVLIYSFRILNSNILILDYFFTALCISWLASFQWIIMCYFMDKLNK
jgi:hypothetical protein